MKGVASHHQMQCRYEPERHIPGARYSWSSLLHAIPRPRYSTVHKTDISRNSHSSAKTHDTNCSQLRLQLSDGTPFRIHYASFQCNFTTNALQLHSSITGNCFGRLAPSLPNPIPLPPSELFDHVIHHELQGFHTIFNHLQS